jgi:hypothetical protein
LPVPARRFEGFLGSIAIAETALDSIPALAHRHVVPSFALRKRPPLDPT